MPIVRRFFVLIVGLVLAGLIVTGHAFAASESPNVLRNRINQGTVAIVSGGVNGTYIRIAADLAAVLDKGDELRVLPIIGKGSVQNITDLLYLRGVDIGIVQSDVLSYIRDQGLHPNIENRIRYIAKLYNEEVHILAGAQIKQVGDLAGRKVNFDVKGSGTFITASTIFKALNIQVEPTTFDQALALEKLKAGEIAAMVYVAGKPTELFRRIPEDANLHFVPIPASPELLKTYLPSTLEHADYPALVKEGEPQDTVAVGAVMAVYNWDANSERFRRVNAFVQSFFNNFDSFLKAPRHSKWQEVNLAATVPGWTRFPGSEAWLAQRTQPSVANADPALRTSFDTFLQFMQQQGGRNRTLSEKDREALFAEFLKWRHTQGQ